MFVSRQLGIRNFLSLRKAWVRKKNYKLSSVKQNWPRNWTCHVDPCVLLPLLLETLRKPGGRRREINNNILTLKINHRQRTTCCIFRAYFMIKSLWKNCMYYWLYKSTLSNIRNYTFLPTEGQLRSTRRHEKNKSGFPCLQDDINLFGRLIALRAQAWRVGSGDKGLGTRLYSKLTSKNQYSSLANLLY